MYQENYNNLEISNYKYISKVKCYFKFTHSAIRRTKAKINISEYFLHCLVRIFYFIYPFCPLLTCCRLLAVLTPSPGVWVDTGDSGDWWRTRTSTISWSRRRVLFSFSVIILHGDNKSKLLTDITTKANDEGRTIVENCASSQLASMVGNWKVLLVYVHLSYGS